MEYLSPLFTDLYQLTMAKAYFDSGACDKTAVFELFFRRCPFKGEYAVAAGYDRIEECLKNFKFSEDEIIFLKNLPIFKNANTKFFERLKNLNLKDIQILGVPEGSLVFPRVPILQIKGPILEVQLLETLLLNAVNFATLIATYARRLRIASKERKLIEFGMRRAQGPNGAMTATRSSYLGGFDGTSNAKAAALWKIPVSGTMAHSFIQCFHGEKNYTSDETHTLGSQPNPGELAAFMAYAKSFPDNCLLLIDTYDILHSGLPNALKTFKYLRDAGHRPLGVRVDSGDFVYFSKEIRRALDSEGFKECQIFGTNELDEDLIVSIQDQGAELTGYGVGTKLVTAASDPALGGVYKLVSFDERPRMKISEQTEKLVLPSEKKAYRFYNAQGEMLMDFLTTISEPAPQVGEEYLALHPSDPYKKSKIKPARIENLLNPLFKDGRWWDQKTLDEKRAEGLKEMNYLRKDIQRRSNPTPYKVSLSEKLKILTDKLYEAEKPTRSF